MHTLGNNWEEKKKITYPNLKGFQPTKKNTHFLYPLSSLAYTNTTSNIKSFLLELKQVKTLSSQSKAEKH
jgi:hypothetical protein